MLQLSFLSADKQRLILKHLDQLRFSHSYPLHEGEVRQFFVSLEQSGLISSVPNFSGHEIPRPLSEKEQERLDRKMDRLIHEPEVLKQVFRTMQLWVPDHSRCGFCQWATTPRCDACGWRPPTDTTFADAWAKREEKEEERLLQSIKRYRELKKKSHNSVPDQEHLVVPMEGMEITDSSTSAFRMDIENYDEEDENGLDHVMWGSANCFRKDGTVPTVADLLAKIKTLQEQTILVPEIRPEIIDCLGPEKMKLQLVAARRALDALREYQEEMMPFTHLALRRLQESRAEYQKLSERSTNRLNMAYDRFWEGEPNSFFRDGSDGEGQNSGNKECEKLCELYRTQRELLAEGIIDHQRYLAEQGVTLYGMPVGLEAVTRPLTDFRTDDPHAVRAYILKRRGLGNLFDDDTLYFQEEEDEVPQDGA